MRSLLRPAEICHPLARAPGTAIISADGDGKAGVIQGDVFEEDIGDLASCVVPVDIRFS